MEKFLGEGHMGDIPSGLVYICIVVEEHLTPSHDVVHLRSVPRLKEKLYLNVITLPNIFEHRSIISTIV